jgi:iron complex transport system substrate-binding protein
MGSFAGGTHFMAISALNRRNAFLCFFFNLVVSFAFCFSAQASVTLIDVNGQRVLLPRAAQRVVSLAPHLTDILLSLGARAQIVGVSDDHENRGAYTRSLSGFPLVSDAGSVNYEKLLALKPDLVLAWGSGTPRSWIEHIRHLGIPVFVLEARYLADLATQIEQLGLLSGHEATAQLQANAFRHNLHAMQRRYQGGTRLTYFYQVWPQPLYSLHAGHLLSQALALCGADNIVQAGPVMAPLINPEFVLAADPDVIAFGAADAANSRGYWSRFSRLQAVNRKQLLAVDDKRLSRPSPDMLAAAESVCGQLAPWRTAKDKSTR